MPSRISKACATCPKRKIGQKKPESLKKGRAYVTENRLRKVRAFVEEAKAAGVHDAKYFLRVRAKGIEPRRRLDINEMDFVESANIAFRALNRRITRDLNAIKQKGMPLTRVNEVLLDNLAKANPKEWRETLQDASRTIARKQISQHQVDLFLDKSTNLKEFCEKLNEFQRKTGTLHNFPEKL